MDNRTWCLYIHKNIINNKYYVGITSQEPEKRWSNGSGYAKHLPFGKAISKYGWDSFEHRVLMRGISEGYAKCMEKYLIGLLCTTDHLYGYNLTSGGDGVLGLQHTYDSKRRMSEAKTGCKHPNYGKQMTDITKKKISEKLTGNKNAVGAVRSDDVRLKMSKSKRKPVVMLKENIAVSIFDSAKAAEESTGISRKNISLCCLGHRNNAGGYSWKFV